MHPGSEHSGQGGHTGCPGRSGETPGGRPGAWPTDTLELRPAVSADAAALHQQWIDAQWTSREDTIVATELEAFDAWVAVLDGEVVAGVFVAPFRQVVGGATFTMAGVRGVTCALHRRRRGIVDRLFRHVLHELRGRYELSCLYPFSPPFYEKFDYGTCEHVVRWRLLLADLDLPQPDVSPRRLTRDDVPALMELITRELPALGNGAVHPDRYWVDKDYFPRSEKDAFPATFGWFEEGGARLAAALCWRPVKAGGEWGENGISVRQVHGIDDDWRRRALGHLRTLGDQFVEVEMSVPESDLFYHHIRKPYRWDQTVRRGGNQQRAWVYSTQWQARLVEPAAVLARPRELHGPGGTIVVELCDRVYDELNGRFRWTLSETAPAWEPISAEAASAAAGDGAPRLRIAVGDLTRLWYGGVDVHQLRRAGRVECDERAAAILHAALGGFRCYMQVGF